IFDSADYMNKVIQTESLLRLLNSIENQPNVIRSLEAFPGIHAVVAHAAIVFIELFTKVVKQLTTTTHRRFSIVLHLLKKYACIFSLLYRFIFIEFLELIEIVMTVEHQTYALKSVPTGTSCFLIISFK